MTPEEVAHFKKQIMNQIVQSKIRIYEFPECEVIDLLINSLYIMVIDSIINFPIHPYSFISHFPGGRDGGERAAGERAAEGARPLRRRRVQHRHRVRGGQEGPGKKVPMGRCRREYK